MLQSRSSAKKVVKPLKNCFFWTQFEQKRLLWATPKMKNIFLAEIIKADHQLSGSFYFIKISCLDWVMNLFLFWMMFSVKKVSFPAKTTVLNGSVKIFYQTLGDEYNSISLHFGKLWQYVFFLISKLRC